MTERTVVKFKPKYKNTEFFSDLKAGKLAKAKETFNAGRSKISIFQSLTPFLPPIPSLLFRIFWQQSYYKKPSGFSPILRILFCLIFSGVFSFFCTFLLCFFSLKIYQPELLLIGKVQPGVMLCKVHTNGLTPHQNTILMCHRKVPWLVQVLSQEEQA